MPFSARYDVIRMQTNAHDYFVFVLLTLYGLALAVSAQTLTPAAADESYYTSLSFPSSYTPELGKNIIS